TYLYEYDQQAGEYVADKLKRNIRNSDAMVVLLTHNSQFSPYVQQEIGYAEGKGKLIIPLVQPGTSRSCLAMLYGREYIAFDLDKPERATAQLLTFLNKRKEQKEFEEAMMALLIVLGGVVVLAYLTQGGQA